LSRRKRLHTPEGRGSCWRGKDSEKRIERNLGRIKSRVKVASSLQSEMSCAEAGLGIDNAGQRKEEAPS